MDDEQAKQLKFQHLIQDFTTKAGEYLKDDPTDAGIIFQSLLVAAAAFATGIGIDRDKAEVMFEQALDDAKTARDQLLGMSGRN